MKYANIIPLIGGMTLGNIKATNNKPEFIVSFKDVFRDNDNHIVTYLNDVPYYDVSEFNLYNEYYEKLDFVSTVCPCAGISMMNVAKNSSASRSGYAKQNNWMYETAEWVLDKLRPKVFWGENAPTLVSKIGEPVRNKLLEIANKYNYSFSLYKTNTLLHGIPQNRARTFYFFWRDSKVPVLNWYKKPHEDILTYINKIPSDASLQDVYFANRGNPSDFMFHKFIMTN
ncbi:MAG TPA: DNA cytosine methyltransferase [Thermotogota bacterium]|nr:DNA cytosine methyltransferase [Thermotogota bacterium]